MVGCESKNGHQKDMCWKEIGLYDHNLLNVLHVIFNIIGETYMIIQQLVESSHWQWIR